VKFLNAITVSGIATREVFASMKQNISNAEDYPTSNCSCKRKSNDIKYVLYEGKSANYKGCMVYKDLQKTFFPALRRKVITFKPQPASI
jgi:hypothetical protein